MKKQEVIDAAKNFMVQHQGYIHTWRSAFVRAEAEHADFKAGDPNDECWNDANKVVNFFQEFYDQLPESQAIRAPGFGALCDICEHIFGFDDDKEVTS